MNVQITTNAAQVNRWLSATAKQIPQAARKALSQTVLQVQQAERTEIRREFTVRKSAFMERRVKVFKFPKTNDLRAIIGIDGKVQGSPLLLALFEDGGTKQPQQGQRVAVPITGGRARKAFRKNVAPSLRMDKLKIEQDGEAWKGLRRTFILPTRGGGRAVFQRVGKTIAPIYVFKQSPRLKRRLRFTATAVSLAEQQLPRLFNRYLRLYVKE